MERASRALLATRYFDSESMCLRALAAAHQRRDYGLMARILMPLLESRRLRRQAARDAGVCHVIRQLPRVVKPGFQLIVPPLAGIAARALRLRAQRAGVPVVVLAREPRTAAGLCPVVGVGAPSLSRWPVVARTRVTAPTSSDNCRYGTPPSLEWFEAAGESLGDAAIASVGAALHPAHRVDELMLLLDAHPDHEKLHQRLADACREAVGAGPPGVRERAFGDPACFV